MADKTETATPEEKKFSFKEHFGYSQEPAEHAQKGAGAFGGDAIPLDSLPQNNDWLKAVASLYQSKEHLNIESLRTGIDFLDNFLLQHDIKCLDDNPELLKKVANGDFSSLTPEQRQEISGWGESVIRGFNTNTPKMLAWTSDLLADEKISLESKVGINYMQKTYEELSLSWAGTAGTMKGMLTDPTTYLGFGAGAVGTKVAAKVAATKISAFIAEKIGERVVESAIMGAAGGAVTGGVMGTANGLALESVEVGAGRKDHVDPVTVATSAAIGAVAGGVLGGGAGAAGGIIAGKLGTKAEKAVGKEVIETIDNAAAKTTAPAEDAAAKAAAVIEERAPAPSPAATATPEPEMVPQQQQWQQARHRPSAQQQEQQAKWQREQAERQAARKTSDAAQTQPQEELLQQAAPSGKPPRPSHSRTATPKPWGEMTPAKQEQFLADFVSDQKWTQPRRIKYYNGLDADNRAEFSAYLQASNPDLHEKLDQAFTTRNRTLKAGKEYDDLKAPKPEAAKPEEEGKISGSGAATGNTPPDPKTFLRDASKTAEERAQYIWSQSKDDMQETVPLLAYITDKAQAKQTRTAVYDILSKEGNEATRLQNKVMFFETHGKNMEDGEALALITADKEAPAVRQAAQTRGLKLPSSTKSSVSKLEEYDISNNTNRSAGLGSQQKTYTNADDIKAAYPDLTKSFKKLTVEEQIPIYKTIQDTNQTKIKINGTEFEIKPETDRLQLATGLAQNSTAYKFGATDIGLSGSIKSDRELLRGWYIPTSGFLGHERSNYFLTILKNGIHLDIPSNVQLSQLSRIGAEGGLRPDKVFDTSAFEAAKKAIVGPNGSIKNLDVRTLEPDELAKAPSAIKFDPQGPQFKNVKEAIRDFDDTLKAFKRASKSGKDEEVNAAAGKIVDAILKIYDLGKADYLELAGRNTLKVRMIGAGDAVAKHIESILKTPNQTDVKHIDALYAVYNAARRKGTIGFDDWRDGILIPPIIKFHDFRSAPYRAAYTDMYGIGRYVKSWFQNDAGQWSPTAPIGYLSNISTLGMLDLIKKLPWKSHMGEGLSMPKMAAVSAAILGAQIGAVGIMTNSDTLKGTGYNMVTGVPRVAVMLLDGTGTTMFRTGKAAWNGNNILDWRNVGTQFYYFTDRPPTLAFQNMIADFDEKVAGIVKNTADPAAAIAAANALRPEINKASTAFGNAYGNAVNQGKPGFTPKLVEALSVPSSWGGGHNNDTPITLEKGNLQLLHTSTQTTLTKLESSMAYKSGMVLAERDNLSTLPANTAANDTLKKFEGLLAARESLRASETPQEDNKKPFSDYVDGQLKTTLPSLWIQHKADIKSNIEKQINNAATNGTTLDIDGLRTQLRKIIEIDQKIEKTMGIKTADAAPQGPQRTASASGTTASGISYVFNQVLGVSPAMADEVPQPGAPATGGMSTEELLKKLDEIATAQKSITPEKAKSQLDSIRTELATTAPDQLGALVVRLNDLKKRIEDSETPLPSDKKTPLLNDINGLITEQTGKITAYNVAQVQPFLTGIASGGPLDVEKAQKSLPLLPQIIANDPALKGTGDTARAAYKTMFNQLDALGKAIDAHVTDAAVKEDLKNKVAAAGKTLGQTDYGKVLQAQDVQRQTDAQEAQRQDSERKRAEGLAYAKSTNPFPEFSGNTEAGSKILNAGKGIASETLKYGAPLLKRWTDPDEVGEWGSLLAKGGLGIGMMVFAQKFLGATGFVQNGFVRFLLAGVAAWVGFNVLANTGVITDWTKTNSFNNNNGPLKFGSTNPLGISTAHAAQSNPPVNPTAPTENPTPHIPAVLPAPGSTFTNFANKPSKLRVAFNTATHGAQSFDIENDMTVKDITERVLQVQQVSVGGNTASLPADYLQVAIIQQGLDGSTAPNIITIDINKAAAGQANAPGTTATQGAGNLPDNIANLSAAGLFQNGSGLENGERLNDKNNHYAPKDVMENYLKNTQPGVNYNDLVQQSPPRP